MTAAAEPLLSATGLVKHFSLGGRFFAKGVTLRAVDGIDLTVGRGETQGLVGESGCGKSTTARLLLRLIEPTAGRIEFDGIDVTALDRRGLKAARRQFQMVFQDPFASLDPRMTVRQIIGEPLWLAGAGRAERKARVDALMEKVGLAAAVGERYPHEFSGGQRQRIGIARALAVNPRLVVCDEPVSALDVSIQAQVINLLKDLQAEFGLSYLFVSHDLSVVRHIADRVAVMFLGKIVEQGPKRHIYERPLHPYTQALLAAAPIPDPTRRRTRTLIAGEVPSAAAVPPGCRFHTRCPLATERCRIEEPADRTVDGRIVACHLA